MPRQHSHYKCSARPELNKAKSRKAKFPDKQNFWIDLLEKSVRYSTRIFFSGIRTDFKLGMQQQQLSWLDEMHQLLNSLLTGNPLFSVQSQRLLYQWNRSTVDWLKIQVENFLEPACPLTSNLMLTQQLFFKYLGSPWMGQCVCVRVCGWVWEFACVGVCSCEYEWTPIVKSQVDVAF